MGIEDVIRQTVVAPGVRRAARSLAGTSLAVGVAAALLGGLEGCLVGPATFVCAHDAECTSGETPGTCQVGGHCSFFDATCDSAQRYSEHGPLDTAGQCVPPPSSVASDLTEGGSSDTLNAGGGETLASTTASDTVTAGSSSSSTDSDFDPTVGESSTGGLDDFECDPLVDEFDDGAIDPWAVLGSVTEDDRELSMVPVLGLHEAFIPDRFEFARGTLTVELGRFPSGELKDQLALVQIQPRGEEGSYGFAVVADGTTGSFVDVRWTGAGGYPVEVYNHTRVHVHDDLWGVWLRIRGHEGGVQFEVSTDNVEFVPVHVIAGSSLAFPLEGWGVRLAAHYYAGGSSAAATPTSFRSFAFECE